MLLLFRPGYDLTLNSNAIFLKKHAGFFLLACLFLTLYLFDEKGEWTEAVDLGKTPYTVIRNAKLLYKQMHSTLNGADNIYWMEGREKIIEEK